MFKRIFLLFIFFCVNLQANDFLVKVTTIPESVKVGEKASLILRTETNLSRNEYDIEFLVDGVQQTLIRTGNQLWTGHVGPFTEIRHWPVEIKIYIRDTKQAQQLREAQDLLTTEIADLSSKIANETNQQKKDYLESIKANKEIYLQKVVLDYQGLKKWFKTETTQIQTEENPTSPGFPMITNVTPNGIALDTKTKVQIIGQNFLPNPTVKIGSKNATVLSATSTLIEVETAKYDVPGTEKVEVKFQTSDGSKNAIYKNAVFVSDRFVLDNLRPVAITNGYISTNNFNPITLDGSSSYDDNSDALSYEWKVTKVPIGSTIIDGSILADSPNPQFTPDKKGIYVIKLKVRETNTQQQKASPNNAVAIEVK